MLYKNYQKSISEKTWSSWADGQVRTQVGHSIRWARTLHKLVFHRKFHIWACCLANSFPELQHSICSHGFNYKNLQERGGDCLEFCWKCLFSLQNPTKENSIQIFMSSSMNISHIIFFHFFHSLCLIGHHIDSFRWQTHYSFSSCPLLSILLLHLLAAPVGPWPPWPHWWQWSSCSHQKVFIVKILLLLLLSLLTPMKLVTQ